MIAIDLSKQQALDADPKAIKQILLEIWMEEDQQQCFLLLIKQNKLLDFLQGTVRVL